MLHTHLYLSVLNAGLFIKSCDCRSIDNFKTGRAVSEIGTLEGIIYFEALVSEGVSRQAEVAQGVPGRLRPWIFFTFRH